MRNIERGASFIFFHAISRKLEISQLTWFPCFCPYQKR